MIILALESSCDETSAAVVERYDGGFRVLSNVIASQIETHRLYGGVVPEIASRAHIEAISKITYEAMDTAGVKIQDIELVAVTANPGLIGALLVGVNFAKAFAIANGIPLVAVDHIKGHIAAAYLAPDSDAPTPPFLALAISGGHTSIYKVDSYTEYHTIGRTRDDAIGEAYDKVGRLIGIEYPAGRGFDALATDGFAKATGECDDPYKKYKKSDAYKNGGMVLPSPALSDGSLDFSFSGLKTAAVNLLNKYKMQGIEPDRALFAGRYTYEATEAVAKKIKEAISQNPGCDLVVAGGVAANSHIRKRLSQLSCDAGIHLFIPPLSYCGDNAAMIAAQGYYEYQNGNISDSALNASAQDFEE